MPTGENENKSIWLRAQNFELQYWKGQHQNWLQEPLFFEATNYYLKMFQNWLSHPGKIVVDVGCGPKGILPHVEARVKIGLDSLMEQYVASGYKILPEYVASYISATGEAIPLKNESVDAVYCINMLDRVMDPKTVLSEIYRILKPKGLLLLYTDLRTPGRTTTLHPVSFSQEWLKENLYQLGYIPLQVEHIPCGRTEGLPGVYGVFEKSEVSRKFVATPVDSSRSDQPSTPDILSFPRQLHRLHWLSKGKDLYVVDIDSSQVLKVEPVIREILERCPSYATEEILVELTKKYKKEEVSEALVTLEQAASEGLFFETDAERIIPKGDISTRPKLFVPMADESLIDINRSAAGVQVAKLHILMSLRQEADIYTPTLTKSVLADGIYGVSLAGKPFEEVQLHFLQHHYDGIFIHEFVPPLGLGYPTSFFLMDDAPPIVVRLDYPRGDGDKKINRVLLLYTVMREFDAFCPCAQSIRNFYSQLVLDPDCFYPVPNGVDTEFFHPFDKKRAKKEVAAMLNQPQIMEKPIVGFFGRFQPEKGASIYLRLAELNPDAIFLVVAPKLHAYALRNLPKNFIYAGPQPREKLPLFLNAFDLHCFPSMVGEEAFSLAVLESMACGVPPVVPRFADLPQAIGDAGIIVDAETFKTEIGSFAGYVSPDRLSESIRKVLFDETARIQLGLKARQRALSYSWNNCARQILLLFQKLNRKKRATYHKNFVTRFVPVFNLPKGRIEYRSALLNFTDHSENPLMWPGYLQDLKEGLALTLLKRHQLHEVEAVLRHICPDKETAMDILHRVQCFVSATS